MANAVQTLFERVALHSIVSAPQVDWLRVHF